MIKVIYEDSRSGVNYEPRFWPFLAERFALTLTERTSQATITIGPDAPELSPGVLLQDDSGPQAGIVWRVKSVSMDYNTNTRTITCEHAINSLRDFIAFGEITPADITGNPKATTCTNLEVMYYIMNKQYPDQGIGGETPVLWRFGSVVGLYSGAYSFNGDDLFSIAESVSSTMHNPWWTYDFSQKPYVFSIVEAPEDKVCQLRLDRNMKSLQVTEDRSRMYTRIWPIGRNDLKLTERYIGKNTATYGIIDHTETNENITTEADLRRWAGERLDANCEPQLTISVNALDLSGITGEELDRIKLGCRCDVVLPDYGKTCSQRVVSLRWNDTVSDQMNVQITLANVKEDVAAIISKQTKKTSSGGRSSATTRAKSLKDVTLTGPVNNVYSLKKVLTSGEILPIGDFSRAVTSWSVVASADTLRVTAKPQEQTKVIPLRMGTITRSGTTYKGYVQYSGNDRASWTNTNLQVTVNAKPVYDDGWLAAYQKVKIPTEIDQGNPALIRVYYPVEAVGYNGVTYYYPAADNSYCYIRLNSSTGDIVARRTNPAWGNAVALVSYPTGTDTSVNHITVQFPVEAAGYSGIVYYYPSADNNYCYVRCNSSTGNIVARRDNPAWGNAAGMVSYPTETDTSKNHISVYFPSSAAGSQGLVYYYVTADGNYCYIRCNSSTGNVVARITNPIPDPTNMSSITTYGNYPPSGGFSFGRLSISGLTAGKYMSMSAKVGSKTFTFYFQVLA